MHQGAAGLDDADLPGFWLDADRSSLRGQRLFIKLSRLRLVAAVVAAIGGALTWSAGWFNIWAAVALLGFVVALTVEIVLIVVQPERDWYAGRALAESAKTLAWRYAVAADPFLPSLTKVQARELMRARLSEVAKAQGQHRVAIHPADSDITPAMDRLREAPFRERKEAYVKNRTETQLQWYATRAEWNQARAMRWRVALVLLEVLAIVLAAGRAFGRWEVDWSGVLAAGVGAGAAWMGLKQYSPLVSAYATASNELAVQAGRLRDTEEADWPMAVASAEEAISREHTMWVASRTGQPTAP